jgi:lysozyme
MLNGIDIASYQSGINLSVVPSDFAIVKATGGTDYVNPDFRRQADQALANGKKLAFYHYAQEDYCRGSSIEEAEFFLRIVNDYKGKAILCLDWENYALTLPVQWAFEFLRKVETEWNCTPIFYSGASYINNTDCSILTKYPLWKASYLSRYAYEGFQEDPADVWEDGDWTSKKIYQYTSEGRLPGWGSNLDLNKFYGSANDWDRYCGNEITQIPGEAVNNAGLKYHVHCQNLGDLPMVHDGQIAGTTGAALRMEGIYIDEIPDGWAFRIKLHMQDLGWHAYDVVPGKIIGTKNQSRRIEIVQPEVLKRPKNDKRQLHFQVHQEGYGWLGETLEGFASGCDKQERRLEAIRMWLA